MADRVIIPLPGIGSLELSREEYQAALRPVGMVETVPAVTPPAPELVTARSLALTLSLPVSCLYEYAKSGRIPCVRVGKHVRFDPGQVVAALRTTKT